MGTINAAHHHTPPLLGRIDVPTGTFFQGPINNYPDTPLMTVSIPFAGNAELQLPSFYNHMPHLTGKPESLVPALKISKARSGVSLVFGIPTIKRPVLSYLIGAFL